MDEVEPDFRVNHEVTVEMREVEVCMLAAGRMGGDQDVSHTKWLHGGIALWQVHEC
jgi:hypothetical protein